MLPSSPVLVLIAFFSLMLISSMPLQAQHTFRLLCNDHIDPNGMNARPLLSWQMDDTLTGSEQTAWQVLVADNKTALQQDIGNLWDSKKMKGGQSLRIKYAGEALQPATRYYWKVRAWDQTGKPSAWSEIAEWQTGLWNMDDWKGALWIGYESMPDTSRMVPGIHLGYGMKPWAGRYRPVTPQFRKVFATTKSIASATLFITGLGQYEASLNGEKISNHFLTPGWTNYDSTVFYNAYDLTSKIMNGNNCIGVVVGNGFHYNNRERYKKLVIAYGYPKMICRLLLKYTDGSEQNIISGTDWQTASSATTFNSIYGGEDYDATKEQPGWNTASFDAKNWKAALVVKAPHGKLVAEYDYPVTVKQSFEPVKIDRLSDSSWLYDFGQNCSGIVQLKVEGKHGEQLRLFPAELRNKEGGANQSATGSPYFLSYTCKSDGVESWQPSFSYYGMRYVEVRGARPDTAFASTLPAIKQISLLHMGNSAPQHGSFSCSNNLFNQIFTLINWGIKSNFVSVLTDCPHREKLGWLEQTFLMGNAIQYNYPIATFYRKIVQDMMDAQLHNGLIPDIAPEFTRFDAGFLDSPEWGSAGIILPWLLYNWYGDSSTMAKAWPMMEKYIGYLQTKTDGYILQQGLGDWYDLGPNRPGEAQLTPKGVTATAIYCYDLQLMAKMAILLSLPQQASYYQQQAEAAKTAFNVKYLKTETGVYATGSQTSMAMPLCLNLVPENLKGRVFQNLLDSIKTSNYALTAGDIGFHYLVRALTENGGAEVLYKMNNREDVPGYGFQLKHGATALTESWQALEIVSNNHLMLGHVMEWFYAGIGGIQQDAGSVAWKKIRIHPQAVGDLTWAKTSFESPYGIISSDWKKDESIFQLDATVPANTSAVVILPYQQGRTIWQNGKQMSNGAFKVNGSEVEIACSSGSYNWVVK